MNADFKWMGNADIKNLQENESVGAEDIFLSAQLTSHS